MHSSPRPYSVSTTISPILQMKKRAMWERETIYLKITNLVNDRSWFQIQKVRVQISTNFTDCQLLTQMLRSKYRPVKFQSSGGHAERTHQSQEVRGGFQKGQSLSWNWRKTESRTRENIANGEEVNCEVERSKESWGQNLFTKLKGLGFFLKSRHISLSALHLERSSPISI